MKIKFMCPECQHCEPESTADNVKTFIVSVFFFVGVLSVSTFVIMSSLVAPQVLRS